MFVLSSSRPMPVPFCSPSGAWFSSHDDEDVVEPMARGLPGRRWLLAGHRGGDAAHREGDGGHRRSAKMC
jgi:hypothetical protein